MDFKMEKPAPPPVYRPQPAASQAKQMAPPVYRPQPPASQPKQMAPPVYRPTLATPQRSRVIQPMKRMRPEEYKDTGFSATGAFHADSSDSESEVEDESRMATVPKGKRRRVGPETPEERRLRLAEDAGSSQRKLHEVVRNQSKAVARDNEGKTKRDSTKKRVVPRVDHSVYKATLPNLSGDAKAILDASFPELRSRGPSTVVCAIFLDEGGIYKKYCFSNKPHFDNAVLRQQAEMRGYHLVLALQSHAEAEVIEYCYTYKRKLFAMGVDKPHCGECMKAMEKYFTSGFLSDQERSDETFRKYHMPSPLQSALGTGDRPKNW